MFLLGALRFRDCDANDYRTNLTWNNRLANLQNAQVYNFYSSGEEVLRNWTNGAAPFLIFPGVTAEQIYEYIAFGAPFGANTWALQELEKGCLEHDNILSSSHNGWKFNSYYSGFFGTLMSPSDAALLTTAQLQTNAFFDTSFFNGLFGPSGSVYANNNRTWILATAIPAVSRCIGANSVTALDQPNKPHNFDMVSLENGWPLLRLQNPKEPNNWYHSDMREVAYTYTHKLFDNMVTLGGLQ